MELHPIEKVHFPIFHSLVNAYYRDGEDADTSQAEVDTFIEFLFQMLLQRDIQGYFATQDGTYIGFALWAVDTEALPFSMLPGLGAILEIGFEKPYRRLGFGTDFVAFIENWFIRQRVERCYVSAYGPAQEFWSRCGYVKTSKSGNNGLPIMIKELNGHPTAENEK